MPTNLPPENFEAEKRVKQASTASVKISALEDLIATGTKHKGTDKLRADFRKKFPNEKRGTSRDLASFIHKDFIVNLKFAKGCRSAKFDGQRVDKKHVLNDRDFVELHI